MTRPYSVGALALFAALALLHTSAITASSATVINSNLNGYLYSNQYNWSPQEVANNTADKSYNVTATSVFRLDINATVSNLTLGNGFSSYGNALTVTGATTIGSGDRDDYWNVYLQGQNQPITCSLGSLSSFANGVFTGNYYVAGPATLQFTGANVTTLTGANVTIVNATSRIVDENGLDGLRNLARIEADSSLTIGRQFSTAGDLTVNGSLSIKAGIGENVPVLFSIIGSLTNFDRLSRTLREGTYRVNQEGAAAATLQFRSADIANNGADLSLSGLSAITDETGRDALRNFSHNLATGRFLLLGRDSATSGDFTNDGTLNLQGSSMSVRGTLVNYDAATKTLNGGTYALSSSNPGASSVKPGRLSFAGADIVHNNASLTLGNFPAIIDENGNDGLRNFSDNAASGVLVLGAPFKPVADFTNEGALTLNPAGPMTLATGRVYRQTAGMTVVYGSKFTGTMDIQGGELDGVTTPGSAHSGVPSVKPSMAGNLTIGAAILKPGQITVSGDVTLVNASTYHYTAYECPARLVCDDPKVSGSLSYVAANVSGRLTLAGALEVEYPRLFPPASTSSFVIANAGTIVGGFTNVTNGGRVATTDGRGSFIFRIVNQNQALLTDYQRTEPAAQLMNISTRAQVLTGNDIAIGGFIVYGSDPKKVVVRAIGPSLTKSGVTGTLQDPVLEVHDAKGAIVATNDNWQETQAADLRASGLAPTDPREAAILTTLQPGAYTAVMRGANNATGVALVEVYDLSRDAQSRVANISTRGFVDTDHVLIGGFIAGGNGQGNAELVVRAIGPSLQYSGVQNFLPNPALEVRDANGALLAANAGFTEPAANINTLPSELYPGDTRDAATGVKVPSGNYTIVVHALYELRGNALVEVYDLNR
ncbi:MAG: hypothetical protein M3Y69_03255 [Verrucomicrobiota bacterium]|nr:hypothetical protein [Verrucomicrobiota bacterium]